MLVFGLGLLSWVATYVGMLELIEANMGDLPLLHRAIIGFSVAMLMIMVVWLLDQIFSDVPWSARFVYVCGYVFLTLISVGFGFGFYWKVLESRGESSRSAEAAVGQVQTSLHAAVTRLEQLQSTLDGLTTLSAQKAQLERDAGTSCPNSRPGDGPRRKLRDDDAQRFKFASDFVSGRVGAVKTELTSLNGDLARVVSADPATFNAATGTRNDFLRDLNRRLDMTVTGFNAFRTDPQLRQLRADLNDRAQRTTFPDTKGGSFSCPDAQLSTALRGVVRAIDELPLVTKPKIAAVEGSEAVVEAFRRLGATFYGALSFKLPPSPEELRELQKKAVQSVENTSPGQARISSATNGTGLSQRDYIPLSIALFVDLCLLLVSIKRPTSPLDRLVPKMRRAEQGPVIQILSRFNEIHRDKEIRENFEVFRHVVFDYHGDYYAAVPLNTPYRPNPRNDRQRFGYGVSDAEQLMQEAHLLANLFASFEKERIFTRVLSPLLSTATIQKRLRRQGSKFANAEAFRVYRFRDGAWSEIILGAVMGAARRVEAGNAQRRNVPSDLAARGPSLDLPPRPADHYASPAPDRPDQYHHADPRHRSPHATWPSASRGTHPQHQGGWSEAPPAGFPSPVHANRATRPSFVPHVVGGADAIGAAATPRHAHNDTGPHDRLGSGNVVPEVTHTGYPSPAQSENVVMHPAATRPAAPPETPRQQPHEFPQDTDPAKAADTRPLPTAAARSSASGTPSRPQAQGRAAESGPSVTVAATRETVTYTLPVSDARLPASLFGTDNAAPRSTALQSLDASALEAAGPKLPAHSLPPPLPVSVDEPSASADVSSPRISVAATDPTGEAQPETSTDDAPALADQEGDAGRADDISTFARRFGPTTREI